MLKVNVQFCAQYYAQKIWQFLAKTFDWKELEYILGIIILDTYFI